MKCLYYLQRIEVNIIKFVISNLWLLKDISLDVLFWCKISYSPIYTISTLLVHDAWYYYN